MGIPSSVCRELRDSYRHEAIANKALVRWGTPYQRATFQATILNISQTGALATCEEMPRRYELFSIRLLHPVETGWIGARAVRFGENNDVGLEFTDEIPYDLMLALTAGIDVRNLPPNSADSHADTVIAE